MLAKPQKLETEPIANPLTYGATYAVITSITFCLSQCMYELAKVQNYD